MKEKIEEFIQYIVLMKKSSKSTQQCYRNDLEKMQNYLASKEIERIEDITATDLNLFVLYIEKQGLSTATIARNIVVVKKFFEFLKQKSYRSDDPTEYLRLPKTEKKEVSILSVEEVQNLFACINTEKKNGVRDKAMLLLFYSTGIYMNELIDLKKEDVNFSLGYLCCYREKGNRVLSFHKKVGEYLKQYDEVERVQLEKEDPSFFLTRSGQAFSRQAIWKILKKYRDKAKIEGELTPFLLRNSYEVHRFLEKDILELL